MQLGPTLPVQQITHTDGNQLAAIDGALTAVRDAMEHYAMEGEELDTLRTPVRLFCELARRERVPPERMLVRLKQAIAEIPTIGTLAPDHRDHVRSCVVQLAIKAYYSDGA